MIYKQCNYSILLLLYDFEFENVEIKQTWTWTWIVFSTLLANNQGLEIMQVF